MLDLTQHNTIQPAATTTTPAATTTTASCSSGWTKHEGFCYWGSSYSSPKATGNTVATKCQDLNSDAKPVIIGDVGINNVLPRVGGYGLIGLRRESDTAPWKWWDNTTLGSYTFWGSQEPTSGKHCVAMYEDTAWATVDCDVEPEVDFYFCQLKLQ